jgi:hypothetical protein
MYARRQPRYAVTADARAASIAGRQPALVEREAVTLPLDHAFGFELADVGSAAIEMQRQCGRADGRGLGGSQSRDRLGNGPAINRDGLCHRVRSCCVAVRIAHFRFRRHGGPCPDLPLVQPGRE